LTQLTLRHKGQPMMLPQLKRLTLHGRNLMTWRN